MINNNEQQKNTSFVYNELLESKINELENKIKGLKQKWMYQYQFKLYVTQLWLY